MCLQNIIYLYYTFKNDILYIHPLKEEDTNPRPTLLYTMGSILRSQLFFSENKAQVYCKLRVLTVMRPADFQSFLRLEMIFVSFLVSHIPIFKYFLSTCHTVHHSGCAQVTTETEVVCKRPWQHKQLTRNNRTCL